LPSLEQITDIARRSKLWDWHIPALHSLFNRVDVRGRRVLEIGGSNLPRSLTHELLGARAWVAIDRLWDERLLSLRAEHYGRERMVALEAVRDDDLEEDYLILRGRAEDIPPLLHGRFDCAVSIAAFEHVDDLALCLDNVRRCLTEPGWFAALFGPIWSGHEGHHTPPFERADGSWHRWNSTNRLPSWSHLLYEPDELAAILHQRGVPEDVIVTTLQHVSRSPAINRLMFEDYMRIFSAARFRVVELEKTWYFEPQPETQRRLMERHPPYREFSTCAAYVRLGT